MIDTDGHADLLSTAEPRYMQLARTLAQEIRSHQRPVVTLLPTEAELCSEWELSRYAVRQAIQKLCALGLVTRQAGVGTKIVADQPQTHYTQSMSTLADLVKYAEGTRINITHSTLIRADGKLAALLHCPLDHNWLHLTGVRYREDEDHQAIALVDMYVDAKYDQLPALSKPLERPLYSLIEATYGIKVTRVDQEIQGVLIEGSQADTLGVPSGSPGLRILRTYYVKDTVIEVTSGLHPGSRFSYSMSFQLSPQVN